MVGLGFDDGYCVASSSVDILGFFERGCAICSAALFLFASMSCEWVGFGVSVDVRPCCK